MKAILVTDKKEALDSIHGTHLQDRLTGVTYRDMVNTFGEPTFSTEDQGDGKVNFEWVFKFGEDIFTVYDWKVSEEYARHIMGRMDEIQFHVGGKTYAGDFIEYVQKKVMSLVQ
jgi:hypothetical protein